MAYPDFSTHALSDSGAYGLIPESEYLRKIEVMPTSHQEDSAQTEQYMRNLMRDFSPDKPYLASDLPRNPNDRGGGTHATEILELRHAGARAAEDPYLPDGTFTDFEFTELDPRGIATTPDMRQHYEQQLARASLIKFYNDEDWSVPEQGINPVQMVQNKKSMFYQFKDRYQNFDESFDSWHNGGPTRTPRLGGSDVNKTTLTGDILDLTDSTVRNRRDATGMLSNDPTIGYRYTVPDQRFKTAKYGLVRANQDKSSQDWDNNRKSTFIDHANMAIIDGQRVNRMLGDLIYDLENRRYNKQFVAQGAAYGDSSTNQVARKKLDPADIYKILRIGGATAHSESANQEFFEGKMVKQYGNKPLNDNTKTIQHVQVNHHVLASMEQATKRQKEQNVEGFTDLRNQVEETAKHQGVFRTMQNSQLDPTKQTANQTRAVEDLRVVEESKTLKNYAGIKPAEQRNPHDKLHWEKFAKHSLETKMRKGRREGYGINNPYDFENDIDRGRLDFGVYNKATKVQPRDHMGRTQYELQTDGIFENEVKEIEMKMFDPA